LPQTDASVTYTGSKRFVRSRYRNKWNIEHPGYKKDDAYYQINRKEQVTIFKLRTGHNKLKCHLFNIFKIGTTDQYDCGTEKMTAELLLQKCPSFDEQRKFIWPYAVPLQDKLYGDINSLRLTTSFLGLIQVDI